MNNLNKNENINFFENEDPIKLKVKPQQAPKLSDMEDDTKNNRLKAFQLMKDKNKKKIINENLNKNDNFFEKNKELHRNIFINEDEDSVVKGKKNYNVNSKNLDVLGKFEEYYKDKNEAFSNYNEEKEDIFTPKFKSNQNYNLELKYTMGINSNSVGSVCFNKNAKWIALLNRNLVIIENFENETNREQKILKDSNSYLNTVKLSENNTILMAYSKNYDPKEKTFPQIYFWDTKKEFELINKTVLKHKEINDSEISMQNNFCAILSSNNDSESFVSILDFYHNEVLVTTVMTIKMFSLKWNKFLTNLEFSTLSPQLYTFWRLNSNVSLQYQLGDFNEKLLENPNKTFTCIEFSPPISASCNILLLLGLSNGEIWGIDTKTNSICIKFNQKNESLSSGSITNIVCTIKYITIISSNIIKYYQFPSLRNMKYDDLNIFVNKDEALELDSDVVSFDIDMIKSNAIAMTKNGVLWYLNYEEKANVRLHVNLEEDSEIIQVKVINKDFQYYSLRKIDFDNLKLEEINSDFKQNEFFLLTGHKNGKVKLWSIPEYNIISNFDVVTEELVCFETCPNDLKLVTAYKSGTLRFFDLANCKFLGKYKALSNEYYKFMRFLPDGKYIFLLDNFGTFFLVKIEKWNPIAIQLHQLFNLSGEIIYFNISPVEQYNRFVINLSNVYLNVYNRKYTNLLKNLEYDNNIPQFSLLDKFNIEEYLKLELKLDKADNVENFVVEFSPKEKSIVFILSRARKVMLVRNFELHSIQKKICFENVHPVDFAFACDSSFVLYILKNSNLQISQIGSEKGIIINNLLNSSEGLYFSISLNSKLIVIATKNSFATYSIKIE